MDQDSAGPDGARPSSPPPEEIIVRADEVDEEGVDISEISSTNDQELGTRVEARRQGEIDRPGSPRALANAVDGALAPQARLILRREASNPPPPPPPRQPPPPAPPAQQEESTQATDSLSLGQLKNLVASFPKLEPTAYAYTYEDTRSFPEELEEWFQYSEEDRGQLGRAKDAFSEIYYPAGLEDSSQTPGPWLGLLVEKRRMFIDHVLSELKSNETTSLPFLDCISYVAMGVWSETIKEDGDVTTEEEADFEPPNTKYRRTAAQLKCIRDSAQLLCDAGAPQSLYNLLVELVNSERSPIGTAGAEIQTRQLNALLTTMYFIVESGREQLRKKEGDSIRKTIVALQPAMLQFLSQAIARIRWDDESSIPFTKMMLLLWKSTLLIFGSTSDLDACKKAFMDGTQPDKDKGETTLTASPLDYHVFRQEITSKYPAFNPPPPLLPIEINNNTMLPPHNAMLSRSASQDSFQNLSGINGSSRSIFHQPVHIATPAPSPPPSPAGPGGKGGKKQNYQTNQNFPFLYPPLDSTSNDLGGKGKAGEGSARVTKKWEGGDVPASIMEAGQLFASRMRMSRPIRQLWEVRQDFVEHERGWKEDDEVEKLEKDLAARLNALDLDSIDGDEDPSDQTQRPGMSHTSTSQEQSARQSIKESDDDDVQKRLDAVETYFRDTFPHLQSIVVVLLKVLLSNITALGALNAPPDDNPAATDIEEDMSTHAEELPKRNINLCQQLGGTPNSARRSGMVNVNERSLQELNEIRVREVTSKAISAYLLALLKWFRLSHILKFEYATQLLLDSNYLPLALKYFALQDVDKAVDLKHDREDLDFFRFCRLSAGLLSTPASPTSPQHPASPDSSSEDEAVPPPIARRRPDSPNESPPPSPGAPPSPTRRPEVDELGYPLTSLPQSPLTTYAPRFFHTHITTLRLLQKLTKNHSHRALLLVQYKSSTILRKALKLPQPHVRLYTLKLFKSQVPFCGRKWRQANMRIITAIYVFCRMGLRDEWISGGGNVEEWVEGAVGVERAWRGLVGWWLGREYRDLIVDTSEEDDGLREVDEGFFARELEKMGFGGAQEEGEWEDDPGQQGPLQLEGW